MQMEEEEEEEEEARLESVFWIRSSKTRQSVGVYQNMEAA
jgi:hypothetical protein